MTRRPTFRSLSAAASVLLLLLAAGQAAGQQQEEASVTAVDQDSNGMTIVVSSTTLPEGGFLVVHDERLLDGDAKGSVVGNSEYLDAGTHENVTIVMDESTEGESVLYVMAHQDTDGDNQYTFDTSDEDGPYTTADGDPVMMSARFTFQEGRTQAETSTEMTDTETMTDMGTQTDTDTFTGGLTDDRTPRQDDGQIGDGEGDQERDEDTPGIGLGLVVAMLAGLALVVARRR